MKRSYFKIKILSVLFFLNSCFFVPKPDYLTLEEKKVETGLDIFNNSDFNYISGKRIGLITNQTGLDKNLTQNIKLFINSTNIELKAVFSPEHGFKGTENAGKKILNSYDADTDLTYYSLYGETKKPTYEMLKDIDVLIFDIQDLGIRSYTYISTLGLSMEAAAENNIEFIVLDRPNPFGGNRIEGNILDLNNKSFIGMYPIPYVYGLTCGELALFINNEIFKNNEKCELKVIKMNNWSRDQKFNETGHPWIPTSPHVPYHKTPFYMVATGILGELGVFSIGVGYTTPFQVIAAPWIESDLLADKMNKLDLKGVFFRPINFIPYYSLYKGQSIGGVQIHIEDLENVNLFSIQFYFLQIHNILYPEKNAFKLASNSNIDMFDKAIGSTQLRKKIAKSNNYHTIKQVINEDVENFKIKKLKYHLYE